MVRRRTASNGPDNELAGILQGVAEHFDAPGAADEVLSVAVERQGRFTHRALTSQGLEFVIDEPCDFGGTGKSADPAEQMLAALCASLSVTLTAHAALRNLSIDRVNLVVRGAIDGKSFFQPQRTKRPGILDIVIDLHVVSLMTQDEFDDLLAEAVRACPVLQTLKHVPQINAYLAQT